MAYQVGQILSVEEARKINAEFVETQENDSLYWCPTPPKKGQLILLNKARYGKKPVYAVVKVTSVKYPGSDYEQIRVGDNEYTWRICEPFCMIPR